MSSFFYIYSHCWCFCGFADVVCFSSLLLLTNHSQWHPKEHKNILLFSKSLWVQTKNSEKAQLGDLSLLHHTWGFCQKDSNAWG